MKKTIILISITICVLLCLTTCDEVKERINLPEVSLDSVNLNGIDFNGVQMLAKVKVEAYNSTEIPFPEIGWELYLNNNYLTELTIKDDQNKKVAGSKIIDVPFSFEYLEAFEAIASLIGKGSADYKIKMALKFNLPIVGEKVWDLEHEGEVPLPQVPEISAPALSVTNASLLSGLTVAFLMNINNKNSFELPAPEINFNFKINDKPITKVGTAGNKLKPGNTSYSTSLHFSTADLGLAVVESILSGTPISTDLSSSVDFGVPAFGNSTPFEWKDLLLK